MVVEVQVVLIIFIDTCLVKDAQHLVKPVVYLSVKARYLYNDAVVVQAVDKLVGYAADYRLVVVVECLMAHIYHRLHNIAYGMSQQVDSHHRQGMAVGAVADHVFGVLVVYAEILAEAQRLGRQPRLLQFYEY